MQFRNKARDLYRERKPDPLAYLTVIRRARKLKIPRSLLYITLIGRAVSQAEIFKFRFTTHPGIYFRAPRQSPNPSYIKQRGSRIVHNLSSFGSNEIRIAETCKLIELREVA